MEVRVIHTHTERERETERSFIHWFTPQLPQLPVLWQFQTRRQMSFLDLLRGFRGPRLRYADLGLLVGIWIESGTAGSWTSTHMECHCTDGGLAWYVTALTPKTQHVKAVVYFKLTLMELLFRKTKVSIASLPTLVLLSCNLTLYIAYSICKLEYFWTIHM